ncbi:MAG: PAS domain S-box protein [Anaerolineaceae bacterium]|nr:MAG: PAS domain S-box protein [Anaerolineaceae bacterium]
MPKKPTSKRLDKLFEGMQDEQAQPADKAKKKSSIRSSEKRPPVSAAQPVSTRPLPRATVTQTKALPPMEESVAVAQRGGAGSPSSLSLAFQMDNRNWATLQVVDESAAREWSSDEQLLVKQVADELSEALESARLFQETRSRAEELSVLNEMGRELTTLFSVDAIAETVYKYASRLMDTTNFFIALYDEARQEITPFYVVSNRERINVPARKLGTSLTDFVLRTCKPLFIPENLTVRVKELGIEVVTFGNNRLAQCWMGAPLLVGDTVLGAVGVQNLDSPNIFTERHRDLLIAISSQAAIAIQNARLFEETQRRTKELDALNQLNQRLSAQLNVDGVLQEIYRGAEELIDATNFYIGLYDPIRNEVTFPLNVSESVVDKSIITIPADKGLTGYVLRERRPVFIPENVTEAMHKLGIEVVGDPAKCWLGVPLFLGEQVIGVMAAQSYTEANAYDEHDRDLLMAVAGQAAISIQNARLFGETQRRTEELGVLNRVVSSASQVLELETMLNNTLRQTLEISGFQGGLVSLYDENAKTLKLITHYDLPNPVLETLRVNGFGNSLCEQVYLKHDVLAFPDLRNGAPVDVSGLITNNILSYFGTPLEAKGRIIGTMCMFNHEPRQIEPRVVELARSIGIQVGFAIENARLFESTQRSEADLRALFASMQDVVMVVDRDTRYIRIAPTNPSRLFRPPDELLGRRMDEILPPETHEPFRNAIRQALEGSDAVQIEYKLAIDGRDYWFLASLTRLNENEVFWVARDITTRKKVEEDLLKFKLGIDQSTDAVFITDPNGIITYANPGFEKIYGYPQSEAVGQNPRIIKSGLLTQGNYEQFWGALLNKQTVSGEIVNKAKDGRLVYVEGANSPILDENGAILGFLAVHHDVTERKRAEESLRLQSTALNTAANAIVLAETDGKITWVNPAFTEQTGYGFEDAVGKTPRLFKSGLHDQAFYKEMWDTILGGSAWHGEVTNRNKNGELFVVQQTITPVRNTQGEITHFASIWLDITERKRQEEALLRRNEYLSATAEIGQLITSTLDMPTLFSRTVNLVRERFGFYHAGIFVTEETGFRAVLEAATGEAGAEMLRQKHSLQVGSKSVVGEVTESGRAVIVNDTTASEKHKFNPLLPETRAEVAIPLHVGARTIGALDIQSTTPNAFSDDDIAVLQTLADQVAIAIDNARSYELSMQAVKEMREADKLKSQFLANMSHELRTPLNSIIGFSRVILKGIDGPITDLQQQDLLAIHNSGQHLLGLINDILDLSRIEAGKMELTFDEVNLSELITSVMSTVTGLVKDKSITLHRELPEDLPTVRADAMRIRQVLLNLLSNAAKFTDDGSITVRANIADSPSGHPEITVSVTDTGPGISQEDQKKLFQPFSQVDASPTRKSGGSGLGLSISSHLVQMHGGRIGVQSAPEKGSTFYFTLPAFRGKPESDTAQGKRIVLAIDDDPQVISLYERYLQPQGYQVVPLSDPSRAVERVSQLKPFAVTLDIMMPGYDGWHVLNDLKSNAETRNVPVIVCSIVEEQEKGFSLGAADYLLKPILEDEILNALDHLNSDGTLREILIVDDDPNDLRLIGRMLSEHGRYHPTLAEGGRNGWESIQARTPHAIILDLFMPDFDGFTLLEKLRASDALREIPVIVVSGGDLTPEQQKQLQEFGQRMIMKHALTQKQLVAALERMLERAKK